MPSSAFRDELVALYPRLWRYCLVLTGHRAFADDLAQAAALRAIEKSGQFAQGTRFDRWIFRIAQTVWFNELRSQKVRQGKGFLSMADEDLPSHLPDAETNIFRAQVFQEIMALPEAQRVTVVLVYVEGYSYAEAAEQLDIPIGTVMSRLAAARKKLAALDPRRLSGSDQRSGYGTRK